MNQCRHNDIEREIDYRCGKCDAARIELLERALAVIGMGQSRCVEPPAFRWIHREFLEHAWKLVDIQDLYHRYPNAAKEVLPQ
jgi:hypothetical protein